MVVAARMTRVTRTIWERYKRMFTNPPVFLFVLAFYFAWILFLFAIDADMW